MNGLKAAGAIVVALVVVVVTSNHIAKISAEIQKNKRQAYVLEKRNETVGKIRQDLDLVGETKTLIKKGFPPFDDILEFKGRLDTLANQNSFQQSSKFQDPQALTDDPQGIPIGVIDYTISGTGSISLFIQYLAQFESLPYFTSLTSFSITANSGPNWDSDSSISFQGRAYLSKNSGT